MEEVIVFALLGGCMVISPWKVLLVIHTIGGSSDAAGPRTWNGLDLALWILVEGQGQGL